MAARKPAKDFGVYDRGEEIMVYDLSHYDLDELRELKNEVEREIKERDGELVRILDNADNGTTEDNLEEVRYEF